MRPYSVYITSSEENEPKKKKKKSLKLKMTNASLLNMLLTISEKMFHDPLRVRFDHWRQIYIYITKAKSRR